MISTYDENLYTTPVPHISELTEEQLLRAKMLEKELGESTKDNEENEDEEALFGAVIGSGRYENLPKPKKPFHKNDDKELYKKMKKGLKTNDFDNNSVGKLESLEFRMPAVEVNETGHKGFVLNRITASKEFSDDISSRANFGNRERPQNTESLKSAKNEKNTSVIDLFVNGWSKYLT